MVALLASAAAIVGVLVVGGGRMGRKTARPAEVAAVAVAPATPVPPGKATAMAAGETQAVFGGVAAAPPRAVGQVPKTRVRRNAGPLALRMVFGEMESLAYPRWMLRQQGSPPPRLLGLRAIVLDSDYVPFYFDAARDMSDWDFSGAVDEASRQEEFARLEPASGHNQASSSSLWNIGFSSDSAITYDNYNEAYTTRTPLVLSLQRSLRLPGLDSLRPHLSLGAGMLRQTAEVRDTGTPFTREEYIPLLRAGLGAEWQPSENFRILLRYEYSRLTSESVLNPSLPNHEHSIQTGVEVRF